ncbi:DUF1330 domain-containing protein [Novosphingobium aquae]|jgi:uncharacterized protein (DUF1330 family)|uniref:DUF1330 domain-containing protein n=1 Tax=Novosphingobium aquae TaxID=3133435 RepID=A0ABU8S7W8_9SPHN
MATYMIFIREGAIVDHEAMAAYQSGNRGAKAAASAMKPLVVYGELETLEGDAADGVVVLQFPDRDAAKAWYFSPEYQEKVKLRQKAAPYRCLMVEGL